MHIALTKENAQETMLLLNGKLKNAFCTENAWDVNLKVHEIKEQGKEKVFYSNATASVLKQSSVMDAVLKIVKVNSSHPHFFEEDSQETTLLHEGDELLFIDESTFIIQQKSIALISILGKSNLTTLYKIVK